MFPEPCLRTARQLIARLEEDAATLTTIESCTGGLIAACITEIAGSSAVLDEAHVTYANAAKIRHAAVLLQSLVSFGAVSRPAALQMAQGGLIRAGADLAVAVTGIAGPGGGSAEKPVGLVHLAAARIDGKMAHQKQLFAGDRASVRLATVQAALELALDLWVTPRW